MYISTVHLMLSMLHVLLASRKVGNNKTHVGSSETCLVGSSGRVSTQRLSWTVCLKSSVQCTHSAWIPSVNETIS